MQKGIFLSVATALFMLIVACSEQMLSTCNINLMPEFKENKVYIDFSVSEQADSIRIIDTSYMIAGVGGEVMNVNSTDGIKWAFNRAFSLPDDAMFLVPAVEIYYKGKLVSVCESSWVDLNETKREVVGSIGQKKEKEPFNWIATDGVPRINAEYQHKVMLGDVVSLAFEANFPLDDLVAGFSMKGFAIEDTRYQTSMVETSNIGERQTFTRLMLLKAIEIGSFESEALTIVVAGKTIQIPIVRIEVTGNK